MIACQFPWTHLRTQWPLTWPSSPINCFHVCGSLNHKHFYVVTLALSSIFVCQCSYKCNIILTHPSHHAVVLITSTLIKAVELSHIASQWRLKCASSARRYIAALQKMRSVPHVDPLRPYIREALGLYWRLDLHAHVTSCNLPHLTAITWRLNNTVR